VGHRLNALSINGLQGLDQAQDARQIVLDLGGLFSRKIKARQLRYTGNILFQ
jgi:hypothetical protein